MIQKDFYLSHKGLEDLKEELKDLLGERKEVVIRIKEAREFGDLSENAEYAEAKNKQSFIEGRIVEIEALLKVVKIIDTKNSKKGEIALGSRVKVKINGDVREYTIAGSDEASPAAGTISNESPIGQALMGHKKNDVIEIETPDGAKKYTVVEIR